jgi:hypothetical protein
MAGRRDERWLVPLGASVWDPPCCESRETSAWAACFGAGQGWWVGVKTQMQRVAGWAPGSGVWVWGLRTGHVSAMCHRVYYACALGDICKRDAYYNCAASQVSCVINHSRSSRPAHRGLHRIKVFRSHHRGQALDMGTLVGCRDLQSLKARFLDSGIVHVLREARALR